MHRIRRGRKLAVVVSAASLLVTLSPVALRAEAADGPVVDPALARSTELSETSRLSDRRFVVTGDRAWALGTADGRYPAAGFHTRGEMGGFWLPNLKLLDGMWFGIGDSWIGPATQTTSGWGYVRADLPVTDGVSASRTDFVPDGVSGALVGLTLRSDRTQTITLRADAHSELMGSYPWGETKPNQTTANLPDTASTRGRHLIFRDKGTPPDDNSEAHNWAAAFGSSLKPAEMETGPELPRSPGSGGDLPGLGPERADPAAPVRRHGIRERRRRSAQLPGQVAGRGGTHCLVRGRRIDFRCRRCPGRTAGGPGRSRRGVGGQARRPGEGRCCQ